MLDVTTAFSERVTGGQNLQEERCHVRRGAAPDLILARTDNQVEEGNSRLNRRCFSQHLKTGNRTLPGKHDKIAVPPAKVVGRDLLLIGLAINR